LNNLNIIIERIYICRMPNEKRGRISCNNQDLIVVVNPKHEPHAIRLASKWGLGKNTWIVKKIEKKNHYK